MTKDPVCGMEIEEDYAFSSQTISGKVYYFCSKVCEEKFLSDPSKYTVEPATTSQSTDSAGSGSIATDAKCSFGNDWRRDSFGHRTNRDTSIRDNLLRVLPKHCTSAPGSKRSPSCYGKYCDRTRPHLL